MYAVHFNMYSKIQLPDILPLIGNFMMR